MRRSRQWQPGVVRRGVLDLGESGIVPLLLTQLLEQSWLERDLLPPGEKQPFGYEEGRPEEGSVA